MQSPSPDARLNTRIKIGFGVAALIFLALMVWATGGRFLVGLGPDALLLWLIYAICGRWRRDEKTN
jgi:hypothetical protein